ncbi:MAG: hypothetical protein MHM6MM_004410 [Cercozoa sp. M6MM]
MSDCTKDCCGVDVEVEQKLDVYVLCAARGVSQQATAVSLVESLQKQGSGVAVVLNELMAGDVTDAEKKQLDELAESFHVIEGCCVRSAPEDLIGIFVEHSRSDNIKSVVVLASPASLPAELGALVGIDCDSLCVLKGLVGIVDGASFWTTLQEGSCLADTYGDKFEQVAQVTPFADMGVSQLLVDSFEDAAGVVVLNSDAATVEAVKAVAPREAFVVTSVEAGVEEVLKAASAMSCCKSEEDCKKQCEDEQKEEECCQQGECQEGGSQGIEIDSLMQQSGWLDLIRLAESSDASRTLDEEDAADVADIAAKRVVAGQHVQTLVYRRRRPFEPVRLLEALDVLTAADSGVVRARGYLWLASHDMAMTMWSQSGCDVDFMAEQPWWSALPREEWPFDEPQIVSKIMADFDGEFGDRRQEICFVVRDLDESMLVSLLDSCLLNDEEMALGAEKWEEKYGDVPFPVKIVTDDDDEDEDDIIDTDNMTPEQQRALFQAMTEGLTPEQFAAIKAEFGGDFASE